MSPELLKVSLLGAGTVPLLERGAWSMVKRLRQATNEFPRPPPLVESPAFVCVFFSLSGLLHQLAQLVLAQMVFLCWTTSSDLKFVKAMKFVELVSGNMLAVTNVAICVNLALVVSVSDPMTLPDTC